MNFMFHFPFCLHVSACAVQISWLHGLSLKENFAVFRLGPCLCVCVCMCGSHLLKVHFIWALEVSDDAAGSPQRNHNNIDIPVGAEEDKQYFTSCTDAEANVFQSIFTFSWDLVAVNTVSPTSCQSGSVKCPSGVETVIISPECYKSNCL